MWTRSLGGLTEGELEERGENENKWRKGKERMGKKVDRKGKGIRLSCEQRQVQIGNLIQVT